MMAVPVVVGKLQIPELLEYDSSESFRGENLKNSVVFRDSSALGLIVAMAVPWDSAFNP
jgi:hypothetical protein